MALCEHCQAVIDTTLPVLPPEFNGSRRSVVTRDRETALTRAQWELLMILYRRKEHLLPYDHLMGRIYGDRLDPPCENILKVLAWNIRTALQGTGWYIHCRWGHGYMLTRTPPATGNKRIRNAIGSRSRSRQHSVCREAAD